MMLELQDKGKNCFLQNIENVVCLYASLRLFHACLKRRISSQSVYLLNSYRVISPTKNAVNLYLWQEQPSKSPGDNDSLRNLDSSPKEQSDEKIWGTLFKRFCVNAKLDAVVFVSLWNGFQRGKILYSWRLQVVKMDFASHSVCLQYGRKLTKHMKHRKCCAGVQIKINNNFMLLRHVFWCYILITNIFRHLYV